ncbi:helix-turn-helix domain-containing protein [Phytoactinopolyspora halotolerans]|uniref:Helix-turn-helix transcriptional regulator n=1 Tax=Phytoactinopolyspora halotolerans TaxID=1981512 RepID=A0A6L9S8J1_9ACTN|nr:AraC family transcriptional regulator [Phytoactinopolyspora halotolerans]NEE01536.1 helix-turn-helix transcriptional regulator [Phytoactinopolyspora halotolerans]
MGWYRPVATSPDLGHTLVCSWTAHVEGRHHLVPDGCVDMLWLADGRIVVCGPETAAWSFVLPPGTEAAGVRFRPGMAAGVLRTPASAVVNQRVGLDDVLGSGPARRLGQRMGEAGDAFVRLKILEDAVRRWMDGGAEPDPVAAHVVHELAQRSHTVRDLADAAGLTERQLQRRCRAAFGYPITTLRRILRLQRFMAAARSPRWRQAGLAGLAHAAGYTDQAHLSHECRRIAGLTPAELLLSEAPDWHGESAVAPPPADGADVGSVQDGTGSDGQAMRYV